MPWMIPAAIIGSSLIGGAASSKAADTASSAANRAADTQLQMFNTVNQQQAPWRQAGETALSDIAKFQPQFTHSFNAGDLNANMAPNYQFMLDQGLGATKNAANLQTGLLSGNTLKGIADYTTNYAGNAYQNAFSNYQTTQNNIFNRLSTIAGLGNAAAIAGGNQGVTAGGNIGSAQIASGAAQAAGTMGVGNALGSGLTNAAGWYTLPQIMNGGGGSNYTPTTYGPNGNSYFFGGGEG